MRFLGHVAEHGEDDEPSKEACDTVDGAGRQRVPAMSTSSHCCYEYLRQSRTGRVLGAVPSAAVIGAHKKADRFQSSPSNTGLS